MVRLDITSISILEGVVTGHCIIGIISVRLKVCNVCLMLCSKIMSALCFCTAEMPNGYIIGGRFFDDLEKVGIEPSSDPLNILSFLGKSWWFLYLSIRLWLNSDFTDERVLTSIQTDLLVSWTNELMWTLR